MIRRLTPLTLILAALAATGRADINLPASTATPPRSGLPSIALYLAALSNPQPDTYIWAGSTGDFTNPAFWFQTPPSPPGSPSQKLIFLVSDAPYTASVDISWTLNSITFAAGNGINLSTAPGAGLLFDGPNPTISTYGSAADSSILLNTPINTTSNLTFEGAQTYTVSGPLSSTGNGSLKLASTTLIYQCDTLPTGFAQTMLNAGSTLGLNISAPDSNPVNLSFGSGPIISTSGTLAINLMAGPQATDVAANFSIPLVVNDSLRLVVTATKPVPTDLYVPGQVVGPGGYLEAANSLPPIYTASFNFTGPILLGGELLLAPNSYWGPLPYTAAQSTSLEFSGTITLDQSSTKELRLSFDTISDPLHAIISGNIVDDPNSAHTARNPLILNAWLPYPSRTFTIAGTHNTYSTGTIIEEGVVTIAPNSSLGTGPITVQFGTLTLTSTSNLNPGQTVLLQYDQGSTLAINFDALPYTFLDPTSKGTLAINTTFSTALDMSRIGNGLMYLSSTTGGIYSADSLRPGSDHVYRLAGNLTLAHSVLADYDGIPSSVVLGGVTLAAPNSYSGGTTVSGLTTAAAPGALGTGNITVGSFPGIPSAFELFLTAPNTYGPVTKVDVLGSLIAAGPNGSIPFSYTPPILHPGSILILDDSINANPDRYPDSMPVNLDGAMLMLKGLGTTSEAVGAISVSGSSSIVLANPATGSNSTTLIAASISRQNHGILFIVPVQYTEAYNAVPLPFSPAGDNAANIQVMAFPAVANGMVAPWIQSRSVFIDNLNYGGNLTSPTSFLNYGPAGFSIPAYISMPVGSGTGTEIVDVPAADGNIVVTGNKSIYALRASANVLSNDPIIPTLHVLSGGVIATGPNVIIKPNVDFGSAEAIVTVQGSSALWDAASLDIQGVVTSNNGITKVGTGSLQLSNLANQIHGPITILEGTLSLNGIPEPSSTDPIQLSNKGTLNFLSSTTLTRPISVVGTGDLNPLYFSSAISTSSANSLTIAAPINAENLTISAGTLRLAAPVTISNGLSLYASQIDLASNISAGYFNIQVGRQGKITGNAVLSSPGSAVFDLGAISPGSNFGDLATLTFNLPEFDIYNGASLFLDLDATGHSDHLFITGTFNIGNTQYLTGDPTSLALNPLAPPTGQIYTLVSASQITGTFDSVTGLPAGYALQYTPTSILLIPAPSSAGIPTPEPATAVTLLLAAPLLLRRRRQPT